MLLQEGLDVFPTRLLKRGPEPCRAQVRPENVSLQPLEFPRAQCIDGIPLPAVNIGIYLVGQRALFLDFRGGYGGSMEQKAHCGNDAGGGLQEGQMERHRYCAVPCALQECL